MVTRNLRKHHQCILNNSLWVYSINPLVKNNPSNVRTILTIARDGRIYLEWYSWHEL